jgi:hypothetical protein
MIFIVRDKNKNVETSYKSICGMLTAGYSMAEIKQGLSGDRIRDGVAIDFSDDFMENLAVDVLVNETHGRMTSLEIAELIGLSHDNVRKIISNAQKKLKNSGLLKSFLYLCLEYHELRKRAGVEPT